MTHFWVSVSAFVLAIATSVSSVAAKGNPVRVQLIHPGVWKIRLGTPERQTPIRFRSAPPDSVGLARLPGGATFPLPADQIEFSTSARGTSVLLPTVSGEQIYGLGLNTREFMVTGRRASIVPSDHPEESTNESHAPEPFYVSSAGYGVYVDTARYATFSFGSVQQASPKPKSGGKALVEIPNTKGVDIYIFAGPTALAAIQRYNLFAGGGATPPLWGLGIAYRGKGDFSQSDALSLANQFRSDDLPCDIFGIEPGWQTQTYSSSFVWNKSRFPDPDGFVGKMHAMGFRMSFWEQPFVHPVSPIFNSIKPFSGNYMVWNGLVPDFATPQARKVFVDWQQKTLLAMGVDSLKLDEVDSQPFQTDRWSFPDSSVFPSGLDGEQMHSLFGLLEQQTMLEPFRERGLRTWGLVRNSHALSAPLPYAIYSDTYDHRCYVRGLAKTGFGGHLWTPEVRDATSVDDLIRRVQSVIFSPYAMINCWYMKLPPWQQIDAGASNRGLLMPEAAETTRRVRELFRLRMSLIPYLYAAFNEYRTMGLPPIRALVLDYPKEPEVVAIDDQFMFGPSLMVAPMFANQQTRSVYFPKGDWYDYFTGEKITGGRRVEVTKSLDQLPLYVKANTLLPIAEPMNHVSKSATFKIKVKVYGNAPVPINLFEDDGETMDFAKGAQSRLVLAWQSGKGSANRTGSFATKRYDITSWEVVK